MAKSLKKRSVWPIVILALIAALFGFGTGFIIVANNNRQPVAAVAPVMRFLRENEPVPDFTLNTLDGQPVSLKDYAGKPVLLNFWASWCPPCLQETADLVAAYQELQEAGVVFIGVGTQDDTPKLKKFVEDNRVPYLIVEDPLGKVSDQYRALGLPTTFLIDKDGNLRKAINGVVNKDQVIAEMKSLARP